MSKRKSQQRKNNRKNSTTASQRHQHQVAVQDKHHTVKNSPRDLAIAFAIYLVVFLVVTVFIDSWIGEVFDAPAAYLLPLLAAGIMTLLHWRLGWRMPRL